MVIVHDAESRPVGRLNMIQRKEIREARPRFPRYME
jgi:hypothetical protein